MLIMKNVKIGVVEDNITNSSLEKNLFPLTILLSILFLYAYHHTKLSISVFLRICVLI